MHTLQVTLFIFLVSLALEIVIDGVGEDALASFISANSNLSVVVSAIVGLIPNCAASVVLTELYLEGALSTGAMLAGLLVSAGVGLLVLFRANVPCMRISLLLRAWSHAAWCSDLLLEYSGLRFSRIFVELRLSAK